jgi:hypothetical protein
MENSRRNLIIIAISLIIVCLCVAVIGVGALGYFVPIERIISAVPNSEPVAFVTDVPTSLPTIPIVEFPNPTPIPTSTTRVEITEPQTTIHATATPTLKPIPPEIAAQMDQIESEVISLRKLQPSGTVTRALLTRDQLRKEVENEFFEDYTKEDAQVDSLVLTTLGLLEPGFDLITFYKDLFSEQILGKYNQLTKRMDVVQGSGFGGSERLTYAHEYTHALQDQNYDIENGLNYTDESCEEDSERCAAVQALIEGDAYNLDFEWFYTYGTEQDLADIQDFFEEYESPILDNAPAYLREDFSFPVIYGQIFVEYLYNLGGWEAVNDAYRNVPLSTEQILHPERYPNDQPENIEIPDLTPILGDDWREIDNGVMGEWYTFLILAHGLQPEGRLDMAEAQAASDGWGGDKYVVYYNEQTGSIVLVMHTSWESVNDASQFYNAFQKHSTARFGAPTDVQTDQIGWTHPGGFTLLSTQNQFTTWILAPEATIVEQIWSSLQSQ